MKNVIPAIVARLFELKEIESVSGVFYNNKRLVERAIKHNLVPDHLAEIFTPTRVQQGVTELLSAGLLQRRSPGKK